MNVYFRRAVRSLYAAFIAFASGVYGQELTPHALRLADGRVITLNLPSSFNIEVAAQGLRRVRFFAVSPDHRIFLTDMYNRADNSLGKIYILDGLDPETHKFSRVTIYLTHLRNPNNLAFYTDPATGQSWIYIPLTDKLIRYRYSPGGDAPIGPPEVLARYPDYGLNYKYGGWHLTRTIAFASLHGRTRLFVAVGSSCDACREKEPVRASLQMMDPDGKHPITVARGLRNAVGLSFFTSLDGGSLFATNMGADHLGDRKPEDTFFELDSNELPGPISGEVNGNPIGDHSAPADYGWPTCYFADGRALADRFISDPQSTDHIFPPPSGPPPTQMDCSKVPAAYTSFAAHSSPLGLAFFGSTDSLLTNSFLVALHGAGHPRVGTGYRIVRFSPADREPRDFITGFLRTQNDRPVVGGRPCGLLRIGPDTFLFSDDLDGVVYAVFPGSSANAAR